MLAAANSSLVAGARAVPTKTLRVRALRAFLVKGKRVEPGTEVELARALGMELVTANKAELVAEPAKAAPVETKREVKATAKPAQQPESKGKPPADAPAEPDAQGTQP